jgi:hypothetical protein
MKTTKKTLGRPKTGRSEIAYTRFTPETKAALTKLAKTKNVTLSMLVSQLVTKQIRA